MARANVYKPQYAYFTSRYGTNHICKENNTTVPVSWAECLVRPILQLCLEQPILQRRTSFFGKLRLPRHRAQPLAQLHSRGFPLHDLHFSTLNALEFPSRTLPTPETSATASAPSSFLHQEPEDLAVHHLPYSLPPSAWRRRPVSVEHQPRRSR